MATRQLIDPASESMAEMLGRVLREKADLLKRLDFEIGQTLVAIDAWEEAVRENIELRARLARWEN